MKFKLLNVEVVDCTSDPHIVSIDGVERLCEILLKVCESDHVTGIPSVRLEIIYNGKYTWKDDQGEEHLSHENLTFVSDDFTKTDRWSERDKKQSGKQAKADKVDGMYYFYKFSEKDVDDRLKLLPDGLTGVRKAIEILPQHLDDPDLREIELDVEVIWDWFADEDSGNSIIVRALEGTINFSNGDHLICRKEYKDYIAGVNRMLRGYAEGNPVEATTDFEEAGKNRGKIRDLNADLSDCDGDECKVDL